MPNTSTGYTNQVDVTATGAVTGTGITVSDTSVVVLEPASLVCCDLLTSTPVLGAPTLTSNVSCQATNATSFQIDC